MEVTQERLPVVSDRLHTVALAQFIVEELAEFASANPRVIEETPVQFRDFLSLLVNEMTRRVTHGT